MVHRAWVRYQDLLRSRYQAEKEIPGAHERQLAEFRYLDLHTGRKCVRWFREAGMTDVCVQFRVENLEYPGSEQMVPHLSLVPPLDRPQDPLWDVYRDIIAEGFSDEAAQVRLSWLIRPISLNIENAYTPVMERKIAIIGTPNQGG